MTDLEEAVQLDPQTLQDLLAWPEFRRWQTERRDAEMRAARPSQQDLQQRYRNELKQRESEGPAVQFHGWTLRPDGSRQYDRSVSPEGPYPEPHPNDYGARSKDAHKLTLQIKACYWKARIEEAKATIEQLSNRNDRAFMRPAAIEMAEAQALREQISDVLTPKYESALAELDAFAPGLNPWPFVS